jgi:predicted deacetylase
MNNAHYLLRFDDICPTMNWRVWAEIESILLERELKPILAVVPDNQDPVLQVDPPVGDFWERVRAWQDRGWPIALHGFQHRYVSRNAGLVAIRKKSEFAGLPAGEQQEKLRRAVEIFGREGIMPRVWIAPGNTFDATTIALLPQFGIRIICDGYFRFPYAMPLTASEGERFRDSPVESEKLALPPSRSRPEREPAFEKRERTSDASLISNDRGWMTWVPQQLFYFRPAPSGVWTVCYHHNNWTESQARKFREDVDDYGANIASLEGVLDANAPRVSKWSEWICTHPRLSRFLTRAQLKLWSWRAHPRRPQRADLDAVQLPR